MNLNQVTVPCTELERSVAFYRRLGLRLIVLDPPEYARFECPDGGSTFSLHRVDGPAAAHELVVYFECENLDEVCARLAHEGLSFESGPTDQPWLWREARLRDPDGNPVCLFFAGTNRLHPPWRIDG